MVQLEKVVYTVRDDLKNLYHKNPSEIWKHPFIVIINQSDTSYIDGQHPDHAITAFLKQNVKAGIKGVVVGRMMAKLSDVKDADGNPIVKQKAIIVTGRLLDDTKRSRVSITPLVEHKDYRQAKNKEGILDEPVKGGLEVPGMKSTDSVKEIKKGELTVGFLSAAFGKEQVMDSKNGQECPVDPIISGLTEESQEERYER